MSILFTKAQEGAKTKLIKEVGKGPKNTKAAIAAGKAYTKKRWADKANTFKENLNSMTKRSQSLKAQYSKSPTYALKAAYETLDKGIEKKKKRLKEISSK